ncbi:P-loop NTPase family protein [Actinomarinicola tropica]|uniref:Uncharacterized protein n=1 Tax=Actinomarinicola tropica TaxID=2789776 RepID=A0A5Q2RJL6_9ACTN|nr:hypothetical protein [Actinomarinicola tropica]QGG94751.1 hypothetical protein GH723_06295 [Actinomarinicola tropica]
MAVTDPLAEPTAEVQERLARLRALDERVRPVTLADRQVLPVVDALAPVLPGGGLRRGSVVALRADGEGGAATSLALAAVAEASGQGSWVAVVGLPTLGLVAAAELGVALDRLAVVATPDRGRWSQVVAALVDAVDLVVIGPTRVRPGDARRLEARARERGAVLLPIGVDWPTEPDLTLTVDAGRWEGIGRGHGHLRARRVRLRAEGRRDAARPRTTEVWLPAEGGGVAALEPSTVRALRPVR